MPTVFRPMRDSHHGTMWVCQRCRRCFTREVIATGAHDDCDEVPAHSVEDRRPIAVAVGVFVIGSLIALAICRLCGWV